MKQTGNSSDILFSFEEISIGDFDETIARDWVIKTILEEGGEPGIIQFIFSDDERLLEINQTYLGHDTLTDIITFNYNDEYEGISGDIFISIPRVRENAVSFDVSFENELYRVIIHGILHLLGYDDQNDTSSIQMRAKENYYLSLRS